jgi:trk system potassium uptake protein TrkH
LIYFVILIFGTLVMSFSGMDLISSATATLACLSNIGPGLGAVGPASNFADINDFGKWFLSGLMMVGRLEIYSVLILILPISWRR